MPRPVCIVASGGVPYVSSLDGPPATPVSDGPPITLVTSGAPPICLINDDGRYAVQAISSLQSLYDPSDLTSIYQSRTGGSTGAVDSVVGIMLDKSEMGGKTAAAFIAGQSELSPAPGPYSATTGITNTGLASLTASGGVLTLVATNDGDRAEWSLSGLTVGRFYRVTITARQTVGTAARIASWTWATISTTSLTSSFADYVFVVPATSTSGLIRVYAALGSGAGDTVEVTQCSARELPGYHALAPSDAARGILARVPATGRRNLLTYSEAFDNAAWTKSRATVSANTAVAPDGTMTADTIIEDGTATSTHRVLQLSTKAALATQYTASAYLKAGTKTFAQIKVAETGEANSSGVAINLTTGAISSPYGAGMTGLSATVQALADGWYRLSFTFTTTTDTQLNLFLQLANDIAAAAPSYSGDGVSFLYAWGAQLETGSTATAYQKVVSARDVTEAGVADKYYLDTDGTDDWMQIFPTLNLGEQWWHVGGWKNDGGTDVSADRAFALSNEGSQRGAFRYAATNGQWRDTSAAWAAVVSGPSTNVHVATLEQTATASLTGRINGGTPLTITPYDDSGSTQGLALFSGQNDIYAVGLDGRFYGGAFGTGTLSSSDRALLERYVAGLTGVTL